MLMQKIAVFVPPSRPVPTSAAWLGALAARLLEAAAPRRLAGPSWLERLRARRAAARAERRDADDREHVMAMARGYMSTQPEFAKDLVAAAQSRR